MTASDQESWARLRLVEGESSAKKWELVSSLGHTTLTVGSNSDCTWVVRGEGVRPIHFSLHWDGGRLRVADVYNAGGVRVDGQELSSQWRPLSGRARIDFGKAAMVIETATSSNAQAPRSSEHPLESLDKTIPSPIGVMPSTPPVERRQEVPVRGKSSVPPRNVGKGTLIGVAPHSLIEAKMLENYQPPSVAPELPDGMSAREARRAERARIEKEQREREKKDRDARSSMKATLVGGLGVSGVGLGALGPAPARPAPESVKPVSPSRVPVNATLLGVNAVEAMRVGLPSQSPSTGAPSSEPPRDEAVVAEPVSAPPSAAVIVESHRPTGHISMGPSRRMTQRGVVSQPPGHEPDAVAAAVVRPVSVSPAADRTERIGGAWQELPEELVQAGKTLKGVQDIDLEPRFPRPPRTGGDWGREERLSDIPTQMRDPASFESRRPARGFPWRYVGVLVLTGVAYFAWLYLLDHI